MDRRVLLVGPQILRVVRCLLRVNRSMNRKVLRVTRQILRVASRVLRMEEECYEWHEKYYVLKKINASDQKNTTSSRRACRMIISVLWVERQALRDKTNVMIWMNKKSTIELFHGTVTSILFLPSLYLFQMFLPILVHAAKIFVTFM